jgi:hypothetical protein
MVVPPLLTELSFVISNAVTRSVSVFTARFLAKTARNDKRAEWSRHYSNRSDSARRRHSAIPTE